MGSKTFALLFVLAFAIVLLMNSEMAAARELANVSTNSKENSEVPIKTDGLGSTIVKCFTKGFCKRLGRAIGQTSPPPPHN